MKPLWDDAPEWARWLAVLDSFMGSGTTAIEAIYQDKRYIGIEHNPKYCDIAVRRIEGELDQTDIFREES